MALEFEQENEQEIKYGTQLEQTEPEEPKNNMPEVDGSDDDIEIPAEDAQLDLFGGEEPIDKKNKKTAAPNTKAKEKAKPEDKVNSEFMIYYAGHRVPVPQDEMTLEQVRSFLEGDFPELSKERTEMLLDKENKQVVPVVKGAKKG